MKLEGIIYKYTSPSGKVYIGQTIDEKGRKNKHRYDSQNPVTYFDRAKAKYGFDNFQYEVLFRLHSDNKKAIDIVLDAVERFFIKKYDSTNPDKGYNLTTGGGGTRGYSYDFTEDHKKKISEALKGRTRDKEIFIKKKATIAAKNHSILVFKDNIQIGKYDTQLDAATALQINQGSISNVLKGKQKTAKGYIFRYEE